MSVTARLTCSIPRDCSSLEAAISDTIPVTCRTPATISPSVCPDLFTSSDPSRTFCTESWMSPLISLAAAALR